MENIPTRTIQEIYDKVFKDVMDEVRQNLSQMKPQLMQMIANDVIQEQSNLYAEKIHMLETHIIELEKKLKNSTPQIAQRVSENSISKPSKIDVSKISSFSSFKYNGWIFYPNEEMGDFLFKVREDGSCNTQLTDYSVAPFPFKISNNCLHFTDSNFRDRQINFD